MKICIQTQEGGSFSVYDEEASASEAPAGMPMGGQMPAEPAAPQGQTAASVDEALDIARQMLGGEGMAPGKSPEELFQGGFAKASGVPLK